MLYCFAIRSARRLSVLACMILYLPRPSQFSFRYTPNECAFACRSEPQSAKTGCRKRSSLASRRPTRFQFHFSSVEADCRLSQPTQGRGSNSTLVLSKGAWRVRLFSETRYLSFSSSFVLPKVGELRQAGTEEQSSFNSILVRLKASRHQPFQP